MTEQSLRDRVAVVTGGAGGIGRALVRALLEAGACVVISDADQPQLAHFEETLIAEGHKSSFLPLETDVSDPRACDDVFKQAEARFGHVEMLVNNAAIGMGEVRADHMTNPVEIHEVTAPLWNRFLEVNLSGAFYMTRAAAPSMLSNKWGRVINVTTSFFTMLRAGFAPYGPAKAGLEALSAGHAQEFANTGVTVNVVVPGGPTDTPMVPAEAGFERETLIPPTALAPPVLWLCSSEANHVSGNRYIAANWDQSLAPAQAAKRAGSPVAWGDLTSNVVWPGGAPPEC